MPTLLIATENQGKVKEFRALLDGLDVELVTPKSLGLNMTVVEDGATYEENAGKKALAYCQASGLISLADDSGLEVEALDGAPGLYSARYSPQPGAKDADRRALLLENLQDKPQPWKAHFHATVAIAAPGSALHFAEGNCYGQIIPQERGDNGFGYDPIFLIPELGLTMAELSMDQKNRLSHRALAVHNAKTLLLEILATM
ncbi:MAG: RdgB/HAM1 family non-canonical purine NTP pyrophosphatase [Chloroflexi bacterium]|nr:MAG: RdgB/HAM1 family non-canonical purine NTP pyrophosphatase [Chloroflexota bacterium]